MRRVENNEDWSLMCPKQSPGLSDCWGEDFEKLYKTYVIVTLIFTITHILTKINYIRVTALLIDQGDLCKLIINKTSV